MASSQRSKQPKKAFTPKQKQTLSTSSSNPSVPISLHRDLQLAAWMTPSHDTHFFLAHAFYQTGHFALAQEHYLKALTHKSDSPEARFNLALSYEADEKFEEAYLAYESVIHLNVNFAEAAFGNLIALHNTRYPFDLPRQLEILNLYRHTYEPQHTADQTINSALQNHQPLRVGFVSADLREHPVGYLLESTLEQIRVNPNLNSQLTLVAYHNQAVQDEATFRLSEHFDAWYRTDGWADERFLDQVKRDYIDILIDLSGHKRGHRLPAFAKRAAPVQVSWLGYWGSTGLTAIDYVIADPFCVPKHEELWFSERIWRLPHLRYCFSIPEAAPEVVPPPCLESPQIVFGCYQKLVKINQGVLQCWSQILTACPDVQLRIQSKELDEEGAKEKLLARMKAVGINPQQIVLKGKTSRAEYLASYAEVDILLDTFHYSGGTTTAEALWMGVPTLTLSVPGMLGRQGESLMVNAGLAEWVTYSEAEYVQKAIEWASATSEQRENLAARRKAMREQVRQSPVFNAQQFAHEFVDGLCAMWREKISQ